MTKLFADGVVRNRVTSIKFSDEEHAVLSMMTAEKTIRTNDSSWNLGKVVRESIVLNPDFFDLCLGEHKRTKGDLEEFMNDQENLSYKDLLSTRNQKWLNYFYESTGCGYCLDVMAFDILGIEKNELQQLSESSRNDILWTIAHLDTPVANVFVKNTIYKELYDNFMEARDNLHVAFYSVKYQLERISSDYMKVAKMFEESRDISKVFFEILEKETEEAERYEYEQELEEAKQCFEDQLEESRRKFEQALKK